MNLEDIVIPGALARIEAVARRAAVWQRNAERLGMVPARPAKPLPMIDPAICEDMRIYVPHVHPPE